MNTNSEVNPRRITVETVIDAPIEKIWKYWNEPEHIAQWAFASDDWRAPSATNELKVGGKFNTRMESADGTQGFDFNGEYTTVEENKRIEYIMEDGRKVSISFEPVEEGIKVSESFEPENENSEDMQRAGWQAILENFKKHVLNG